MDKNDVGRVFYERASWDGHGWYLSDEDSGSAMEAIAQAAEEETEQLRATLQNTEAGYLACSTILEGIKTENANLRPQVAVMAEALGTCQELIDDLTSEASAADAVTIEGVVSIIQDALSAVPKVLHHEMGKWDSVGLMCPVVRLKRPLMLDARSPDDVMTGVSFCAHGPQRFDEFPGQQAEVFVTECPVKEGCQRESEQEKSDGNQ